MSARWVRNNLVVNLWQFLRETLKGFFWVFLAQTTEHWYSNSTMEPILVAGLGLDTSALGCRPFPGEAQPPRPMPKHGNQGRLMLYPSSKPNPGAASR